MFCRYQRCAQEGAGCSTYLLELADYWCGVGLRLNQGTIKGGWGAANQKKLIMKSTCVFSGYGWGEEKQQNEELRERRLGGVGSFHLMGRQNPLTLTYNWFSVTVLPMVKLKSPLLSLGAKNTLSKAITFVRRRGQNIAEKKPEILDAKSPAQVSWRTMFNLCVDLWHTLSAAEKREWESAGTARHMTGYAWYMSQCLRPNPGIYLPLLGGTMQGAIDMAKHRLLKLPAPVDTQEPATKSYTDARFTVHAGLPAVHHAKYTDADVLLVAAALLHASRHIPGGADPMRWAADKLLLGAGAGSDPTEVDPTKITTGTFTGNAAANRAIPHGLGIVPKVVFVVRDFVVGTETQRGWIFTDKQFYFSGAVVAVTAMNATNFYVSEGFNVNGGAYRWVAMGQG